MINDQRFGKICYKKIFLWFFLAHCRNIMGRISKRCWTQRNFSCNKFCQNVGFCMQKFKWVIGVVLLLIPWALIINHPKPNQRSSLLASQKTYEVQPEPKPVGEKIFQFPKSITPPMPQPIPTNQLSGVTKLLANQLDIITSDDIPIFVIASPQNMVKISEETGRIRIKGFLLDSDDPTKYSTKLYDQKQIFIIEAEPGASGLVEILVITLGKKSVARKTLQVESQSPPPLAKKDIPEPKKEKDDPKSKEPEESPLTKLFQNAYQKDTDTDKATLVGKLAAVYRNAAKVTAQDTDFKTTGDIEAVVDGSVTGVTGTLSIPNVREAIKSAMKSPPKNTPLDNEYRQRYAEAWSAIGDSLLKVVK